MSRNGFHALYMSVSVDYDFERHVSMNARLASESGILGVDAVGQPSFLHLAADPNPAWAIRHTGNAARHSVDHAARNSTDNAPHYSTGNATGDSSDFVRG